MIFRLTFLLVCIEGVVASQFFERFQRSSRLALNETHASGKEVNESSLLKIASVTICSIVKNEQLYVDEWLQYHRYMGFDRVHLFDNAATASTYLAGLPEKYGDYVVVNHLPGLGQQVEAYHRCIKGGAGNNTWAAFIDVDEFIVLRKHESIKAFLLDIAPTGGSVVLNWNFMGNNNWTTYNPSPVVNRFVLTSVVPNIHIKSIVYLPHAYKPNIHNCYMKPGYPTVDQHRRPVSDRAVFNPGNDREIAYINHYCTKSWEEFKLKRNRGFASNFKKNHLFASDNADALERIADDYAKINKESNAVQDNFARDFYLRHHFSV